MIQESLIRQEAISNMNTFEIYLKYREIVSFACIFHVEVNIHKNYSLDIRLILVSEASSFWHFLNLRHLLFS